MSVAKPLLGQCRSARKRRDVADQGVILATIPRALLLLAILLIAQVTPCRAAEPPRRNGCAAVFALAGSGRDAGPALQACVNATPRGGTIAIPPGRYLIAPPVRILHPLILRTQGRTLRRHHVLPTKAAAHPSTSPLSPDQKQGP